MGLALGAAFAAGVYAPDLLWRGYCALWTRAYWGPCTHDCWKVSES